MRTRARYWQAGKPALITYILVTVNLVAFFALGFIYDLPGMLSGQITEAHVRFGLNALFVDGQPKVIGDPATDGVIVTNGAEWYRLITSGFLHYGVIHIAFNMLLLFQLGSQLEPTMGRTRFGMLYAASLLGGSAGALVLDQGGIVAGASGAVFGLMGAYVIGMWRHGINPVTTSVGSLMLINLFLTFTISNISIGGHLGGAIAGAICGFVLLAPPFHPVPTWTKWAVPTGVGVLSVVVAVMAAAA